MGDGTNNPSCVPKKINAGLSPALTGKTITKVFALGDDYQYWNSTWVIDDSRNVYSTGYNGYGQLGINNTSNVNVFTQIYGSFKGDYVIGGGWNSRGTTYLMNTVDHTLRVTGSNSYYQHGNGTTTNSISFELINTNNSTWKSLAVGSYERGSVIAIDLNDNVWTWGYNSDKQLGSNSNTNIRVPTQVTSLSDIKIKKVLIQGAQNGSCYALDYDGDLWTCGYNGYGQLGNGYTTTNSTFTKVIKDGDIKFVDFDLFGADNVSGFLAADQYGNIWGCGYNGQYSTGVTTWYGTQGNQNLYIPLKATIN